jgi:hypothetical protein
MEEAICFLCTVTGIEHFSAPPSGEVKRSLVEFSTNG